MNSKRFRVGLIGLQPNRSWSARAHIPALRAMPDRFEISGVANSNRPSAEQAATACGIARAFNDVDDLVTSRDVDIVAVTVKTPYHYELVKKAVTAGKHVYCEWPLGNGLFEAEELAQLAREKGVMGVIGTQARVAPEIELLRRLLDDGFVGEVLSSRIVARGRTWGPTIDSKANRGYMLDAANGATMLTIPMSHTLAAVRDVLGDIVEVTSYIENRRKFVRTDDTGEVLPMNAPDQIVVGGLFASGAPLSIHFGGGLPRGEIGFVWEILGADGELRVTAAQGNTQMIQLTVEGARGDERQLTKLLPPAELLAGWPESPVSGNVARLYSRMATDLTEGTNTAPKFDDAIALHRLIASIEESAAKRCRIAPSAPNRRIPLSAHH